MLLTGIIEGGWLVYYLWLQRGCELFNIAIMSVFFMLGILFSWQDLELTVDKGGCRLMGSFIMGGEKEYKAVWIGL